MELLASAIPRSGLGWRMGDDHPGFCRRTRARRRGVRHMKRFVFVESNTTGTGGIAVQRLLARGHRVTFLTRTRGKYPFLRQAGTSLCVQELDTNDLPVLLAFLREVQRQEGIDAILTLSEFY